MTDREIVKSAISRGTALRPLSSQRRDGSSTVELINCASVPRTGCNLAAARNFQKKVATSKIKKRAGLGNKFFTERFRPSQKCHRRSWVRICFVSGFLSPRSSHNVLRCFLLQLASERRTQSKVPVKPYSGYGYLSTGTISLE